MGRFGALKGMKATDFIYPDEERPVGKPIYVVNTTPSVIKIAAFDKTPALTLGCFGAPECIAQTTTQMLDHVPFMALWSTGKVVVSTDSRIVAKYGQMRVQRDKEQQDKERLVAGLVSSRDDSSDIVVGIDKFGQPQLARKGDIDGTQD